MLNLHDLPAAIRAEGGVSRRLFLATAAAVAALPRLQRAAGQSPRPRFPADPFALGVASGDPHPTGVVLWTRLAPKPLDPQGGMDPTPVDVRWELADDTAFTKVIRSGTATAGPDLAHSVHVEVNDLPSDRWFFYRFRAGDATSPVGRTRTAPAADRMPDELRFAFASCQHYETGHYTAYQHMAADDLDLVFHLGDYIYEGAGRDKFVRKHAGGKLRTLADYRTRHAQYRSDPHLQAAHARCPWAVTWDDHEVENDYANDHSLSRGTTPAAFLLMRAAAYQAYYEAMPLRAAEIPRGPDLKLYRTLPWGTLAAFQILDTRQYRTPQPNGDKPSPLNDAALDPRNTLLGADQRAWLQGALAASPARWNVLAQQVMMGMVDRTPGPETKYSMDQWPGYAHERMKLVEFIQARKVKNPVVLTGDIHSNWANDLRVDDRKAEQPVVAAEFVGTSISSGGNGVDQGKGHDNLLAENPCVRFHNRQRGYVRCAVRPGLWRSEYVVVPEVTKPGGPAGVRAAFLVESGRAGVQPDSV